jgi:carbonic anhydrase
VRLIVVLGHQSCLAIRAAIQAASAPAHIDRLVKLIRPAVEKVLHKPGDLYENAIQSQTEVVVELLKECQPILSRFTKERRIQVVGARYELISGKVNFFPTAFPSH